MDTPKYDEDATESLMLWLANDYRFAHEASTLLDKPDPEAELRRFTFRLVWELHSTVAGRRVRRVGKRWELTQERHRLPQDVFARIDWSEVRDQVESMELDRTLPDRVKKMQ